MVKRPKTILLTLGLLATSACGPKLAGPPGTETVSVTLAGGHETDQRDHGRPVALIGPALGVSPEIFRAAFSGVSPARNGHPTEAQARANKQVLLDALARHGITNERLDEVSDFYRYQPQDGGLWKHSPADVIALVKDGRVIELKIRDGGYGYTTPPRVQVPGFPDLPVTATVEFGTDLKRNGRLAGLTVSE